MVTLAAFAPAIVKIIMMIFGAMGMKKANQRKFLQNIIDNSKESVSVRLRDEWKVLLEDTSPKDDDVF